MDVWLERLRVILRVAEIIAADESTSEDINLAKEILSDIGREMNDKRATMPAAGGTAGASRQLPLVIMECLSKQRDEPSRMQLRSAITLTKERLHVQIRAARCPRDAPDHGRRS